MFHRLFVVIAPRAAVTMTLAGASADFGSSFHDLRGHLPVVQGVEYRLRDVKEVKGVVWHHTATKSNDPQARITSIAKYHTAVRGWPAIAYHYAIDEDGVVYQMNDVTRRSNHAEGYNKSTISVALIGNYQEGAMSAKMESSAIRLNEWLRGQYKLEFAWLHKDTKATACPGKYAEEILWPHLYGKLPK